MAGPRRVEPMVGPADLPRPDRRVLFPGGRGGDAAPAEDGDDPLVVATSDEQARFALPGGGGVHVCLLFDGDSIDGRRALRDLRASTDVGWCALLSPVAIDARRAPKTARWFGLQSLPVLLAVWDGAVLAIEHDFDPDALRSLAVTAIGRYRALERDG